MRGNSQFGHNYSWLGVQGIKNHSNDNKGKEAAAEKGHKLQ